MISFDKALRTVLRTARPLGIETVRLQEADGRVLAKTLKARFDMPRFDQSAMDGFAVRLSDLDGARPGSPVRLELDGDIPAGRTSRRSLSPGHTVKVFTGSMLPAATEAVVMVEYSRVRGRTVELTREPAPGDHIRNRGEEYGKGHPLLERGTRLDPPSIGLLATFGHPQVPVYARPTVTLLTIGDELVPLGKPLSAGKIYNSNLFSLTAALKRIGSGRIRTRSVPDNPGRLRSAIARGLGESDVVLAAGGASVGDYDYVRPVAKELGIVEMFRAIALKPGKPVFFGTWRARGEKPGTRLVFGLPGNPVSSLVSLHQLVRPALLRMMGVPEPVEMGLSAELSEECRKRHGRLGLLRGRLEAKDGRLVAHPRSRQGSHMLGGMAVADCLILFPADRRRLEKGEQVGVKLLSW